MMLGAACTHTGRAAAIRTLAAAAPDPVASAIQRYGHAKMRTRLPNGRSLFPAFWMLPRPEINIMKVLGDKPDTLYTPIYRDSQGRTRQRHDLVEAPDPSSGWHVFAVDWRAKRFIVYPDGVECWRYKDAEHIPTYLPVNLAAGGRWPRTNRPFRANCWSTMLGSDS